MRLGLLEGDRRALMRGAAAIISGGLLAGCSSGAMRFSDGVDGLFTGSTANQRAIIGAESQPYPGDAAIQAAPVDGVAREAATPVTVSAAPVTRSTLPEPASTSAVTAAPAVAAAPSARSGPGWSGAEGTKITIRNGETVYNLSRRYGVPASAILAANGMSDGSELQAGRTIVIPAYAYDRSAPVSAPDSDPRVAEAKSSRGTRGDTPLDKRPDPQQAPEKVAVLPQPPKVREAGQPASSAPQSEAAATSGAGKGAYTVQSGDTLSAIARKTGVSVTDLKAANGMKDGFLRIGQTLVVPAGGAATTVAAAKPAQVDETVTGAAGPAKKADGAEVAGYTPPKAGKAIEEVETLQASAPDATGIGRMRWPARGRVISGFGARTGSKANDGIDIALPEGTSVKSAENGVVIYAGDGLKEFGNTVLVRHEDGLVTVYGYASELKVARGDKVKRGQEIALSGMSGSADVPKLHFEVRKNSAPVDPATYLE